MASEVFGGMMTQLFPSLGPALMISMGYIDLGKWVAAVEGGARFGFDLVFLVLLFNCTAILCQYLSTCIGTVTGKDLAEICSEEYCRVACILLGVQAELSMIISDITMILGIGYGLNLLFGMDLFASIFYATVGTALLPSFLTLLDNCKAEAVYVGVAGSALLFYVLGVLISQPEVPLVSGIFPKLSGESAYSLMALLGANIMAHNFYIHSSIVKQKRQQNVAVGALFHDHFFAILFIFTGIFLVNYVLMNSAAAVFGSTDVVFNFQDVSMLMDQGILEPAFSKPRQPLSPCSCLDTSAGLKNGLLRSAGKLSSKSLTTASVVLEIIKEVEIAVSGRKGRTGTAAGDVAFPKGKENLASVLKRYKRRLLNKFPVAHEGASTSRKIPSSASSSVL